MDQARHVFEEHVGEIQIRIDAPSLAELFGEAGRALAGLLIDPSQVDLLPEIPAEEVVVRSADREALLADWLNELIFRAETRHCAFTDLLVTRISDREVRARVKGVEIGYPRIAVKAATLHGLRIDERAGRCSATVVLDV